MANKDRIQEAIELLQGVATGGSKPSDKTIADLWQHMTIHHKFAATTFKTYTWLYQIHVGPRMGERLAMSIGPEDLNEYCSALRETRKVFGKEGEMLKPATRNRIMFLLKSILNHGVENRLIPYNPIIVVSKEQEHNIRETVVSEQQLETMLTYADAEETAYILLLRDSGLRRREGCRVQWGHFHATDPDPRNWRLYVTWKSAKGSHARYTLLTERAWTAIQALPRTSEYVFPGPRGDDHVSENYMLVRFRGICEKGDTHGPDGNITLHDLRRTFATKLGEAGVSERLICKLLGHRSRATIDRYLIGGQDDLRGAQVLAERGLIRELTQLKTARRAKHASKAGGGRKGNTG